MKLAKVETVTSTSFHLFLRVHFRLPAYLVSLFQDTNAAAIHAKRCTMYVCLQLGPKLLGVQLLFISQYLSQPKDLALARALRGSGGA